MWVSPMKNLPKLLNAKQFILMLVFTIVLSCLVDWMIELSISNREQTRNIGNFTLYSFNTLSGREWNGLPCEHLWDQLGRAVRGRVSSDSSTATCDQVGDQHEEEVPGCCGCVWIFHPLLRLLTVY